MFDKTQIREAKQTLKGTNFRNNRGLSKPEALLMLKQSGFSVTEISKMLVKFNYDAQEIGKLFVASFNVR